MLRTKLGVRLRVERVPELLAGELAEALHKVRHVLAVALLRQSLRARGDLHQQVVVHLFLA